ncbi:MAG: DUF2066 domain-containing protein [Pseudomonadota bacterium]
MTELRHRFLTGLWIVLFLFNWGSAQAERVTDLYAAEVPVAGHGAEARAAAIRKAFARSLAKVTGVRSLSGQVSSAKVLRSAPRYVQQYRYRTLEIPQTDLTESDKPLPDLLLWVRFDERAVNRLLRDGGLSVWGGARPSTLIWIGLEQGGRRSLYQPELEPQLRGALEDVARERGLPILMPLMDLEDRSRLQVSDVWGAFEENIRAASDRYLPDVILVGRLRRRGGNDWVADWTLYQPDIANNWQTRGEHQTAVVSEGLHRAVDALAARFAPRHVAKGTAKLRVRVSGLNHMADYVLVRDYLQSLVMIEQLDLLMADAEKISFIAKVQGGRDALERGILLGGVLEPVVTSDAVVSADATPPEQLDAESLDYRLR